MKNPKFEIYYNHKPTGVITTVKTFSYRLFLKRCKKEFKNITAMQFCCNIEYREIK